MHRLTFWLAVAMCVGGCRAPAPTMQDISPFGATRIEPPRTNSFGTPDSYYQPPAATKTGAVDARRDDEPHYVDVPDDRERTGDVALVGYDEQGGGGEDDELAWGTGPSPGQTINSSRGGRLAGDYRPGSVAQAAYEEDGTGPDGSVSEPSTLRILEASPLPGGDEEPSADARGSLRTASRSGDRHATSTPSDPAAARSTAIRFQPMPVHDATEVRVEARENGGDSPQDISRLPSVPADLRDRLQPPEDRPTPASNRAPGGMSRARPQAAAAGDGGSGGWRGR